MDGVVGALAVPRPLLACSCSSSCSCSYLPVRIFIPVGARAKVRAAVSSYPLPPSIIRRDSMRLLSVLSTYLLVSAVGCWVQNVPTLI